MVQPLTLKGRSHSKAIQSIGSTLEKHNYITITPLLEGDFLIRDNQNEVSFYFKGNQLYRVAGKQLVKVKV